MREIFVTGGTGYIGSRLIAALLARGHRVRALARADSAGKLPVGCWPVLGNALDAASYMADVPSADTFVQLVGVPHPSPAKAAQFRSIDLASALAGIAAASQAGVGHFVYVSVAQPAPVMRAYIEARVAAEAALRASGLNATILRPWYVLGPGHWWPYALVPGYWLAERFPPTRETALRLGLVTVTQLVATLVAAVEHPVQGLRVVGVPEIRTPPP